MESTSEEMSDSTNKLSEDTSMDVDTVAPDEQSENMEPATGETPTDIEQKPDTLAASNGSPKPIDSDTVARMFLKDKSDDSENAADALATLASAALNRDEALNSGNKSTPAPVLQPIKMESSPWCDVGIVRGTSCVIKHFYCADQTEEHVGINSDELPDYSDCQKIELLPGTAYKFRVCAINAYGRGEWSDVSAFKTCLPGFPGAPSSIKISKSNDGAHLSWEPPPANSGKIIEYSVCLAVRNATIQSHGDPKTITSVPGQLAFVRVYCGPQNQAVVHNTSLAAAHVDTTAKPAIIFRIAAKNDKGYGPATQVRWLQDSPSTTSKTTPSRKDKSPHSSVSAKKYKTTNSL